MSELGPMQYEQKSEGVFLGRDYNKTKNYSDQVALEIDREVRKIIENCYADAKKILHDNEELVMTLSKALIERETLTKEEIESLVTTGKIADNLEPLKEGEPSLLKLREIAKSNKIKGYTKMTKEELEKAIKELEKE